MLTFSFENSSPCTKINLRTRLYNAAALPASGLRSAGNCLQMSLGIELSKKFYDRQTMVTCHRFVCTRKTRSTKWSAIIVDNRGVLLYENFHAYFSFRKQAGYKMCLTFINPLTPVPPVTGHQESWPFFHFWHHHFWLKFGIIYSRLLQEERSFKWFPDQSDRLNGTWDMYKNAQKVEWKTRSKISCHYTWLLHGKNCLPLWRFFNDKQAQ